MVNTWGPKGTYAEAVQRREDEANRKKRIRDGSPDYFRVGEMGIVEWKTD